MSDGISRSDAESIDDRMAQAMLRRREERPERRQRSVTPRVDRRRICGFCFQRGDHPTPTACLKALERA